MKTTETQHIIHVCYALSFYFIYETAKLHRLGTGFHLRHERV